jgi:hypothetical protein
MDFDRRVRQPIEYAGIQSGINQSNQLEFNEAQNFQAINQINNRNMADYNDLVDSLQAEGRAKVKEKQKEAIEKVGEYGTAITEKYNEYKEFIKEGGKISEVPSLRFASNVGGLVGKAGRGVKSTISSTNEPVEPLEFELEDMRNPANNPSQAIEQQGIEDDSPNQSQPSESEQPESNQAGSSEADETREASSNSGENAEVELGAGRELEEVGQEASKVGKIGKGIAKVGGALFSATMLGSDIYDQVKSKSVFYGENTGDKVGNFMNEIGSGADLLGVATGDPLLVMAGVGLGAVGGLVSDISELFGHHKQQEAPPPPPPKVVQAPTQVNLAGAGGIVQSQPSTLRAVEMGA